MLSTNMPLTQANELEMSALPFKPEPMPELNSVSIAMLLTCCRRNLHGPLLSLWGMASYAWLLVNMCTHSKQRNNVLGQDIEGSCKVMRN